MKHQSSIEWLEDTVKSISVGRASTSRYKEMILELIRQAKDMHKEEHGETFTAGVQWMQYQRDLIQGGTEYWEEYPPDFNDYYEQTFNK